jgi:hypothetical protein
MKYQVFLINNFDLEPPQPTKVSNQKHNKMEEITEI